LERNGVAEEFLLQFKGFLCRGYALSDLSCLDLFLCEDLDYAGSLQYKLIFLSFGLIVVWVNFASITNLFMQLNSFF